MKQEKNQTVWPNLKPYQQELLNGLRKGAMTHIHMSRRSGKSYMKMYHDGTDFMMQTNGTVNIYSSSWNEWEDAFVWPWDKRESIESGKRIWGRIKTRTNKVVFDSSIGGASRQYATKKEVFQRKLKGDD